MREFVEAVQLIRRAREARSDVEHTAQVHRIERYRQTSSRAEFAVAVVEQVFENASVLTILACMAAFGMLYQLLRTVSTLL